MNEKILVVDDEKEIVELLSDYLTVEGYVVVVASNGREAVEKAGTEKPDLVLLDIMMPGLDGFEVCRILRAQTNIPIVMLSAKQHEGDKVLGLGLGADDYIAKPFSPREVVARVRAQLRRATVLSVKAGNREVLRFPGLEIYLKEYRVTVDGREVSLQAREFELLCHMAQRPRQVFTKELLFEQVWGEEYLGDPNTLSVHIRRLREKIEEDPARPRYIKTVWGVGYKFEGDPL